jgi:hypothetical protein
MSPIALGTATSMSRQGIVDGIDVAQLLRDIGEASASTNPVDLFGLCLGAQRALAGLLASRSASATPAEAALLASYRAMNDDGQPRLVSLAKHVQKRFVRQQPALALVPRSQRQRQCTAGFGDPFVLLGVAVIGSLLWVAMSSSPAPAPAVPAPTPGAGIAYVPYVFADQDTGCQYLSTYTSSGLVPRITADGKRHMGCKGDAR